MNLKINKIIIIVYVCVLVFNNDLYIITEMNSLFCIINYIQCYNDYNNNNNNNSIYGNNYLLIDEKIYIYILNILYNIWNLT